MTLQLAILLAEAHMAEVSLQYREEVVPVDRSGFWWLLVPAVALAAGAVFYKFRDRPPAIVNTPTGMLHELCRNHRINARGRVLLESIAEEVELEHPATMLLGVTQFEAAVEKAGKHIQYDRRQNSTLGMLRRRLFA